MIDTSSLVSPVQREQAEGSRGERQPVPGEAERTAATGFEGLESVFEALEGASVDGFMALTPVRGEGGHITDLRWAYLNAAVEGMLGRARGELYGRLFLDELPYYRDSELLEACRQVVETGASRVHELRNPIEERRWYRVCLARCLRGLSMRFHDISAQKRAEEELLDRDMHYRLLSRATNDVLWDWDVRKSTIQWGEAVYTVLGYARSDVQGSFHWWEERLHPEDRDRVVRGLNEVIVGEGDAWSDEYRFRRANGTYAFYYDRGFVVRDERGRPYRMLGSMVDLTDRVRAEEALLESEERFRATFSQAAVGMALVSPDGTWLKCNQRLCGIVGYPCDELIGHRLSDITHPDDAGGAMRQLQRVLAGELKSHSAEVRCVQKGGAPVWVNLTISLVREASGAPKWFVAIIEDIHERKRLEEEARRAQEFESQLHGIVGHDIRSPLAAIKATVSALLARPDLSEAQRKAIARIARSTERIQRLVQQLLDYTRLRFGDGIPVQRRPADLLELCRRVVDELQQTYPGRALVLDDGGVDGRGEWDPDRLMQLVSNLVENALKYGDPQAPVTLSLAGDAREVVLRVHNLGEPISPAILPTLFEPFRRGVQNAQTVKMSLGLGLYVVREVVRAHGGIVSVRSNHDEGTTLTVRLPRYSASRAAESVLH